MRLQGKETVSGTWEKWILAGKWRKRHDPAAGVTRKCNVPRGRSHLVEDVSSRTLKALPGF